MFKIIVLVVSIINTLVNGECPEMTDIPVMYDDQHFMCFNYWDLWGDDVPVNACNGITSFKLS